MELISLCIPTTKITDDGSTWTYGIEVTAAVTTPMALLPPPSQATATPGDQCWNNASPDQNSTNQNLTWTCYRRFSEFLSLAERLERTWGLRGLPSPPPKSIGRPQSPSLIEERRAALECWLQTCCVRADVRTCLAVLDFLQWEANTNMAPCPLSPVLEDVKTEGRFFLSSMQYIPGLSLLFASFEEAAAASRLGRVWSIVERDAMGSIAMYKLSTPSGMSLELDDSLQLQQQQSTLIGEGGGSFVQRQGMIHDLVRQDGPCRVKDLFFHTGSGRVFLALDSGHLEVYQVPPQLITEGAAYAALSREETLPLHTESILFLSGSTDGPGRVLSVSLDKTIRVVNCSTLETLCGGKLEQRLDHGIHLTVGELEDSSDEASFVASRIFLGTSAGRVLVLSSQHNPPQFIKELAGVRGTEPITAVKVAGSNLLAAQKRLLHLFRIGKGNDPIVQLIRTLEAPFHSGRSIRSIAVSVTSALMFLGHEGGSISLWDCGSGACVSAVKAHGSSSAVAALCCVEGRGRLRVVSAGRDGTVRLWRVPDAQQLCTLWQPPGAPQGFREHRGLASPPFGGAAALPAAVAGRHDAAAPLGGTRNGHEYSERDNDEHDDDGDDGDDEEEDEEDLGPPREFTELHPQPRM